MIRPIKTYCPLLIASLVLLCSPVFAAIELPRLFSDGAVLQRDRPLPLAGKAAANSEVVVTLGDARKVANSNQKGEWQVQLPAMPAGGPVTLRVTDGQDSKEVENLYLGDVWVASGQSNMEWVLRDAQRGEAEINAADRPQIRQFKVPLTWAARPEDELAGGSWKPATQAHKGEFSAVGYFFANRIHAETGIPVGLISSNWGGSSIEAWMSPKALGAAPQSTAGAIDQLGEESREKTRQLRKTLERWPGALMDGEQAQPIQSARADWSAPQIDTDDWLPVDAAFVWEAQGFPGMDGVVWYRKTFDLSEEEAAGDLQLGLGRIDDNDTTFVNGYQVGATRGYDVTRQYTVAGKHLRPGRNTLAVRVEDSGGGGGIYSSPDLLFLDPERGERRSLAGTWQLKADKVTLSPIGNLNQVATALYNKMLHPLYDFPVKGVIWYQGESNAGTVEQANRYAEQFQAMIKDWREGWGQPTLPFYWVQLANFNSRTNTDAGKPWAIVREAQTAALQLPNTGQAITIDVGSADDIHPRDKRTVGERLARIALNQTYGQEQVHFRGPVFTEVQKKANRLIVEFQTGQPLAVKGGGKSVHGFEIITADGSARQVTGQLKGSSVVVNIEDADSIAAIRYAWDDNPEQANLVDQSGLPAEPFRATVN